MVEALGCGPSFRRFDSSRWYWSKGDDVRVSADLSKTLCWVCKHPCIPLAGGDNWFNPATLRKESVVVCRECGDEHGDEAFKIASENKYWEERAVK